MMRGFRQLEKADRSSVPWMLDYRSFAEAGGKPTGVDASSRPSVPLSSIFRYLRSTQSYPPSRSRVRLWHYMLSLAGVGDAHQFCKQYHFTLSISRNSSKIQLWNRYHSTSKKVFNPDCSILFFYQKEIINYGSSKTHQNFDARTTNLA